MFLPVAFIDAVVELSFISISSSGHKGLSGTDFVSLAIEGKLEPDAVLCEPVHRIVRFFNQGLNKCRI